MQLVLSECALFALSGYMSCIIRAFGDVECTFSTFDVVHSKLRSRLGTEKAAKLVCLFVCLFL